MSSVYRYIRGSRIGSEAVEFNIVGTGNICVVNVRQLLYGIKTHPCANGDDLTLTDEAMAVVLEVVMKERHAIKYGNAGKPKTSADWSGSGLNLDEYLFVGCDVDEALVDEMMNVLPPHRLKHGYLQVGEPYSDAYDERSEQQRYRPTYSTFHKTGKNGRGVWTYAGHCFSDETINRMPEKDVAGGMLRELRKKLGIGAEYNSTPEIKASAEKIVVDLGWSNLVVEKYDGNDITVHLRDKKTDCVTQDIAMFCTTPDEVAEGNCEIKCLVWGNEYDESPTDEIIIKKNTEDDD